LKIENFGVGQIAICPTILDLLRAVRFRSFQNAGDDFFNFNAIGLNGTILPVIQIPAIVEQKQPEG